MAEGRGQHGVMLLSQVKVYIAPPGISMPCYVPGYQDCTTLDDSE